MAKEHQYHIVGKAMVFRVEADDPECDEITPVEITELDGDTLELAFDTHGQKKRTYLRFDHKALAKAMKAYVED